MNMMDAVPSAFQRYAQFSGRATRPEFWWWLLTPGVGLIIVAILCAQPTTAQPMDTPTIRKPAGARR